MEFGRNSNIIIVIIPSLAQLLLQSINQNVIYNEIILKATLTFRTADILRVSGNCKV